MRSDWLSCTLSLRLWLGLVPPQPPINEARSSGAQLLDSVGFCPQVSKEWPPPPSHQNVLGHRPCDDRAAADQHITSDFNQGSNRKEKQVTNGGILFWLSGLCVILKINLIICAAECRQAWGVCVPVDHSHTGQPLDPPSSKRHWCLCSPQYKQPSSPTHVTFLVVDMPVWHPEALHSHHLHEKDE